MTKGGLSASAEPTEPLIGTGRFEPVVTIAIPTYERADLLRKCLDSVMAQTYPKLEILVSDNASTDGTLEMLAGIDDDRLRVVSNPENVGAVANFNKCIAEGRGDYLVLACDDTIYQPFFVEKCVRLIQEEPGLPIVMAGHDVLVINEFFKDDERHVPARLSGRLTSGIWQGTDVLEEFLQGRLTTQLVSSLVRIDVIQNSGGLEERCISASDTAILVPMLLEGRAGLINESCATALGHPEGLTETFGVTQRLSDVRTVADELAAFADERLPDAASRKHVRRLLNRYVALTARYNFLAFRRNGGSLLGVMRNWPEWGPLLKGCTISDYWVTWRLRSIIRFLAPQWLLRWMLRHRMGALFWRKADTVLDSPHQ